MEKTTKQRMKDFDDELSSLGELAEGATTAEDQQAIKQLNEENRAKVSDIKDAFETEKARQLAEKHARDEQEARMDNDWHLNPDAHPDTGHVVDPYNPNKPVEKEEEDDGDIDENGMPPEEEE